MVESTAVTGTLGKYTLTKKLGEGVSAKVKLAHDEDGKPYAIKIFDLSYLATNRKLLKYM